jgi:hypothetical protein
VDAWRPTANELGPGLAWGAPLSAPVLLAIRLGTAYFEAAVHNDEHGNYPCDNDHDYKHHILRVHIVIKDLAHVFEAL